MAPSARLASRLHASPRTFMNNYVGQAPRMITSASFMNVRDSHKVVNAQQDGVVLSRKERERV